MYTQSNYLRSVRLYAALQDGFDLVKRGNWTHFDQLPCSDQTETDLSLWTALRAEIPNSQILTGNNTDQVWLLYTNENQMHTYMFDCKSESWIVCERDSCEEPLGTI